MGCLIVFLAAGIAGACSYAVNLAAIHRLGAAFQFGTLAVIVLGCFQMGLIAQWWTLRNVLTQSMRLFLTTGLLGDFTTFSAFSLDVALLWEREQAVTATLYATLSVVLSVDTLFRELALVRICIAGGVA